MFYITALVGSHAGIYIFKYLFHFPLKISSLYILNICLFYINKKKSYFKNIISGGRIQNRGYLSEVVIGWERA